MVHDLDVPTTIVPCPTVREADGLAMSSRNVRLSPAERKAATVLWRALSAVRAAWAAGERDAGALERLAQRVIRDEPLARADYVAIADPSTLEPLTRAGHAGAVCCLAVWIGEIRLIDNLVLPGAGNSSHAGRVT
jgi:pantoate--beta-alanine ligase